MTIKKNNHGLSQPELSLIKNILLTNADITRVGVFGSRANGKYKDYSDIDLVLYGDLDERAISRINTLFEAMFRFCVAMLARHNNLESREIETV